MVVCFEKDIWIIRIASLVSVEGKKDASLQSVEGNITYEPSPEKTNIVDFA